MSHNFHILADGADYGKLIGFVVFAIIWGISGLASLAKKLAEQNANAQRKANEGIQRQMMAAAPPARPPAIVRPALTRAAVPPTRQRPVVKVALPPPLAAQAGRARQIVAPAPPASQSTPLSVSAPATQPAMPGLPRSSAASRRVAQLLTPAGLRQQFILTEIIQPPVSLREPSQGA